MKYNDYLDIVPAQITGTMIDVHSSLSLENNDEARRLYEIAKDRLLDMGNWHSLVGLLSAKFQIINGELVEVKRTVQKRDFVKVDIPGPGNTQGNGYDWVHVKEVKEIAEGEIQSVGFQVQPSINPLGEKQEIAHFYAETATSNFIVTREENRLTAFIIDRNLKPNTATESLLDVVRNSTTGIGAIGIFSKVQWQRLADSLVKKD